MREWRCKGWSIIYDITFVVILKNTLFACLCLCKCICLRLGHVMFPQLSDQFSQKVKCLEDFSLRQKQVAISLRNTGQKRQKKQRLEALIVCNAEHGFHINIKVMLPINKKLIANRYHPSLCQLRARAIQSNDLAQVSTTSSSYTYVTRLCSVM